MTAKYNNRVMRFSTFTRLMCPNCLGTSSNHPIVPDSWHENNYQGIESFVVVHKCKFCGYTDDFGSGFIDSGNYDSYDTNDIQEWKDQLHELEQEADALRSKIENGERIWADLWHTDEDRRG